MNKTKLLLMLILILSSNIFISCSTEKVDGTNNIISFADKIWNANGKYNRAKLKVKQKEYKGQWVKMTGKVNYISEQGEVSFEILGGEREIDWDRYIEMRFVFDNFEDAANFHDGQIVTLEGQFEKVEKGSLSNQDYRFIFTDAIKLPTDSITTREYISEKHRKAYQKLLDSAPINK